MVTPKICSKLQMEQQIILSCFAVQFYILYFYGLNPILFWGTNKSPDHGKRVNPLLFVFLQQKHQNRETCTLINVHSCELLGLHDY